jgi:hypothetical protein
MVRPLQALEACLGSAHGGAGASYMGFPAGKSRYCKWMFSNGTILFKWGIPWQAMFDRQNLPEATPQKRTSLIIMSTLD